MYQTVPSKPLEWTNLVLGGAIILAPFVLGFAALPAAAWSAYLVGALIVCCSAVALVNYKTWAEWTNVMAGLWLIIAPFLLGFANTAGAMWTHIIVGVCVATIAGIQLYNSRSSAMNGTS